MPTRAHTEGLVITDKEATNNMLLIRYPVRELKTDETFGGYRDKLIEGLYGEMLAVRMQELTQQAEPPFIQGGGRSSCCCNVKPARLNQPVICSVEIPRRRWACSLRRDSSSWGAKSTISRRPSA